MGYPITYTLQNPMVLWYSFLLVWWFITANSKNCCALRCFQQPISRCGILASRGLWNSWHNGCTAAACSILRFIDGECESVQCTQCTQVYPPVFRMQRRAWGNQAGNGGVKTHTGFAWKLVTQNAVNDHVPCKNDQVWGGIGSSISVTSSIGQIGVLFPSTPRFDGHISSHEDGNKLGDNPHVQVPNPNSYIVDCISHEILSMVGNKSPDFVGQFH